MYISSLELSAVKCPFIFLRYILSAYYKNTEQNTADHILNISKLYSNNLFIIKKY